MTYAAHRKDFGSLASAAPPEHEPVAKKAGILRRTLDAITESRQRAADRQVARFLAARSGGMLTDGLKREIAQRLFTSNWSVNADFNDRRFP